MKIHGFFSLFIIANSLTEIGGSRSCIWSTKSLKEVRSCPLTKEKWEEREREKDCKSLGRIQNCTTDASKFKYHCVINEFENGFVEVCAPVYNINGHCAEYNELGQRIQLHYNLKCSDVKPPCAKQYLSTEAYLYKGCYDIVEKNLQEFPANGRNGSTKDSPGIESNVTVGNVTKNNEFGTGSLVGIIIGIMAVVFIISGIVIICVKYFRNRNICAGKLNKNGDEENVRLKLLIQDPSVSNSDKKSTDDECKIEDFEHAIECGKMLRRLVSESETTIEEKLRNSKADSEALFEAYDKILNSYMETQLTKTCEQKLKQTGVLLLSGIQGSGKTLTAIHIMNSNDYNGWTKLKFTSCEDLLAFDIEEKTVIIIDNIFYGYLYSYPLQRWWHSLCYFYFENVRKRNDIHLIITAKTDVIEKASAHLKANFQLFHVKTESFPLTYTEKISLLEIHINLAAKEKGIHVPQPFLSSSLEESVRNHTGPIGFPLCAYLYAFEDRRAERDDCIFKDTVAYVRKQIAHTIDTDNTYRVKTLLLILLFYQSPPGSNYVLDLKYREDCYEFLKQDCFKEWVDKIKPIQAENLHEIAKKLERTLFLKHLTLHEVYLNGVGDYFLRTYWEVAVPYFPLDILRTGEFKNMSEECSNKLVERFKQEIMTNTISKTLSSTIFEDPSFERKFGEELHKENKLKDILLVPDKSSEYKLPAIFWANKYHLKILSKKLWDVAKTNERLDHFQFYLARFGECCGIYEIFITSTPSTLDVTNLKEIICHFRTSGKETILHLLVSSEKSDYDAYCFLRTILQDIPELANTVDTNLLKYALTHSKRSRLLCTLEIINRLIFRSDISMVESIPCVIDHTDDTFWELEWIVRICIAWTHNEEQSGTKRIAFHPMAKDQRHLQELLDGSTKKQKDMVRIMKACIEEREKSTPSSSGDILKIDDIPFKESLSSELKKSILESIQEQLKKDDCF